MLQAYISTVVQQHPQLRELMLLTKEYLVSFYANCGFVLLGPSAVVHGQDQWLEMKINCYDESTKQRLSGLMTTSSQVSD
jgi:predicted GNAT family N-acyltransferase